MTAIWLTPGPAVSWTEYEQLIRDQGWQPGEPFPVSDSEHSETPYVTPDGTRVVVYHPTGGVTWGGQRAIAIYEGDAARTADAIEARIAVTARTRQPVFHRFQPNHTAACAGPGGVWYVDSKRGHLRWHADGSATASTIATGLHSPIAIARGRDVLFVMTCDDPRHARLARVDPATGYVTWIHLDLDRPTQLAVVGDIVHVACAGGLVRVDRTGALDRPAIDAPPPWLLGTSGTGLMWIDPSRRHVVAYDGDRAEVIAGSEHLISLDVDGDRAYALDDSGTVLECRRGRPPKRFTFADDWTPRLAGVLRLGPLLIAARERDDSYATRIRCEIMPIGFPELAHAPAGLLEELATEPDRWVVASDWLAERGVVATPAQIGRMATSEIGQTDTDEGPGYNPGPTATSLVTVDRETGYHVVGADLVTVLRADEWY